MIAKAAVPGRVKTRLSPPCSPEQAAALARAALADTLAAAGATAGVDRRVLVLDGAPGPPVPPGWEIIPQRGGGLADRLAGAFADTGGPALLVGMDTPQVTPALLEHGLAALAMADAVLGRAPDGGFWAIGLQTPDPAVFAGVPMSVETTGAVQARRLDELGLRAVALPELRDVDDIEDARAVAALAPDSAFARALAAVEPGLEAAA